VRENRRIEIGSKLDKASNWLNIEGIRYNVMKAKLEQVESRGEELLKELQSLYDQKKDLSCQMVGSKDLLQVANQEVFDLQGQINTLNVAEVIEPTTKASLEKTKAYVKESFEDLPMDPIASLPFFSFFWTIESLCIFFILYKDLMLIHWGLHEKFQISFFFVAQI